MDSFQPTQESAHIDLLPNSRRKQSLQGYTFHFIDPSSPYYSIVPLAGGTINSSPLQSIPVYSSPQAHLIVIFTDDFISDTSSIDTASLFMNRIIPFEALQWVRRGWVPLAEQELMRSLLFEGELAAMIDLSVKRCSNEMNQTVSPEETQQTISNVTSEDSALVKPTSLNTTPKKVMFHLKRPESTHTIDEVEAFFEQLEMEKVQPITSKKRHVAEMEVKEPVKETEPISEVIVQSSEVYGGKGKRFVKKSIKKARNLIPLHAYPGNGS